MEVKLEVARLNYSKEFISQKALGIGSELVNQEEHISLKEDS